jgi:hypothetical protein
LPALRSSWYTVVIREGDRRADPVPQLTFRSRLACSALLASAVALLAAPAAFAVTIWTFDLPGTALASQDPPYPTVATLTLTETADGVQFVLDPNEASPGFSDASFLDRLDYVYGGVELTAADFRHDAGAPAEFEFEDNPNNMDAGYAADDFHIIVEFPSKNDPDRFEPGDTSTWTVLGATLADFTGTFATANSKPSPIHGVLSVASYSLPEQNPTPSNWVAGVPEPSTTALVGLGGVAALRASARNRRRSRR